jgi:SAM-dependent methyltransferase
MKAFIRDWIPPFMLQRYGRFRRHQEQRRNQKKSVEQVFTEIYAANKWGGAAGEFCSGDGSTDEQVVAAYVSMVADEAVREGFAGMAFVDLGCGDFRVGRQLLPFCSSYTGVDIVKPLIARNQETYGNANVRFTHLDVVQDEPPAGDVCFVRQVLQHLSNRQIAAVLGKLRRYRWVFITEHYPTDNGSIRPNLDKVHGGDVRVYENSGVYLSAPPFDIPESQLRAVLEVPGAGTGNGADRGVLRTFLYRPQS